MPELSRRRRKRIISKSNRSAITNGADFFDDIDGRSSRARRYRDIKGDLLFQLSYPSDLLTTWSVKQLAAMLVLLEESQRSIVAGLPVNMDELVRLSGAVRRHVAMLGLSPAVLNGQSKGKRKLDREYEDSIGGFTTPPDTK
jgi:hypothetical protein